MRVVDDPGCAWFYTHAWMLVTGEEKRGVRCKRIEHEHGYALLVIDGDTCVLQYVYVEPGFRRRGIGTMLVEEAVRVAREEGCRSVEAAVVPVPLLTEPRAMRRILRKLGFEEVAEDEYRLLLV